MGNGPGKGKPVTAACLRTLHEEFVEIFECIKPGRLGKIQLVPALVRLQRQAELLEILIEPVTSFRYDAESLGSLHEACVELLYYLVAYGFELLDAVFGKSL